MSEAVGASHSASSSSAQSTSSTAPPPGGTPTLTMGSTFSSVDALMKQAPALYNQLLIGVGTTVCQKMADSQERIKEKMREDEAEAASEN